MVILIGDYYRYQRFSFYRKSGMVNPIVHAFFYRLNANAQPFKMGFDCSGSCLKRVHLALRIAGRGVLVTPPVVQHFWNVVNPSGRLCTPENKVVILGAVKLLTESSHGFCQIPVYHKQMADIIDAGQ